MIQHVIETINPHRRGNFRVDEFSDAVVIHDQDGDVSWVHKDDLPKLIGKLAEIAGQHISSKAA